MSKAFTRESDTESADEVAPLRPQQPPGVRRSITRGGAERLRGQLADLLEARRRLQQEGSEAAGRLAQVEAGVRKLQATLDAVAIAEPPADPGKVGFGAFVRIRDQHGEEATYQIVGPDEAEPGEGRISSVSPLARALMNSRAGETVRFQSPMGEQQLTILSVQY